MQNYPAGVPAYAYLHEADQFEVAAVISYGPSITSSYDACSTAASGLEEAGYNITYEDLGAQLGGKLYLGRPAHAADRARRGDLAACRRRTTSPWPGPSSSTGSRSSSSGSTATTESLLDQYSSLMQGVYFEVSGTVPYEAAAPKFGNTYPGMKLYIQQMNKYAAGLHLQRCRAPGLAVRRAAGPGRVKQSSRPACTHPGQHRQHHQPDHRLHRPGASDHGDQLGHRPHHDHLSALQRLRAGPERAVRARSSERATRSSSA